MSNTEIRKLWEAFINDAKYSIYFISNEEKWKQTLEKVKNYISENNKRPSKRNKNPDIRSYGAWISMQQQQYKKTKYIMNNPDICKLWEEFVNDIKYSKYF